MTLADVQRLDGAYWFVPGRGTRQGRPGVVVPLPRRAHRRQAPAARLPRHRLPHPRRSRRCCARSREVPMNIEIKGRDGDDDAVYRRTAELLAAVLKRSGRRDIIVASFEQPAIDRFHELAPRVPVAPGIDGTADFLLVGQVARAGRRRVPGADHVRVRRPEADDHHAELRQGRARGELRGARVALQRPRGRRDLPRACCGCASTGSWPPSPSAWTRVLRALHGQDPCGTRVAARGASRLGPGRRAARAPGPVARAPARPRAPAHGRPRRSAAGRSTLDSDASKATAARPAQRPRARRRAAASRVQAEVVERGRVVSRSTVRLR